MRTQKFVAKFIEITVTEIDSIVTIETHNSIDVKHYIQQVSYSFEDAIDSIASLFNRLEDRFNDSKFCKDRRFDYNLGA